MVDTKAEKRGELFVPTVWQPSSMYARCFLCITYIQPAKTLSSFMMNIQILMMKTVFNLLSTTSTWSLYGAKQIVEA